MSPGTSKRPHKLEEGQDSPPDASLPQRSKHRHVKHINPLARSEGHKEALHFVKDEGPA